MPVKSTKWGMKVWMLCNTNTGYCISFNVYTGRHGRKNTTLSLGEKAVMNLSAPFWNQRQHLYFDRFFISVDLMKHLYEKGTYICATDLKNCHGLPQEVETVRMRQREVIQH